MSSSLAFIVQLAVALASPRTVHCDGYLAGVRADGHTVCVVRHDVNNENLSPGSHTAGCRVAR